MGNNKIEKWTDGEIRKGEWEIENQQHHPFFKKDCGGTLGSEHSVVVFVGAEKYRHRTRVVHLLMSCLSTKPSWLISVLLVIRTTGN